MPVVCCRHLLAASGGHYIEIEGGREVKRRWVKEEGE